LKNFLKISENILKNSMNHQNLMIEIPSTHQNFWEVDLDGETSPLKESSRSDHQTFSENSDEIFILSGENPQLSEGDGGYRQSSKSRRNGRYVSRGDHYLNYRTPDGHLDVSQILQTPTHPLPDPTDPIYPEDGFTTSSFKFDRISSHTSKPITHLDELYQHLSVKQRALLQQRVQEKMRELQSTYH